jgi:hypothetical protein
VLRSGEFQPLLPAPVAKETPITLRQEQTIPQIDLSFSIRGEASLLRIEVLMGPQDSFSSTGVYAPTEIVLPQTLQISENFREQAEDPDCRRYSEFSGKESLFEVKDSGILFRRAPIDGAEQIAVPSTLRPRLLHL